MAWLFGFFCLAFPLYAVVCFVEWNLVDPTIVFRTSSGRILILCLIVAGVGIGRGIKKKLVFDL